jgi:outer membrane lipoprotein carrier protein
MSQKTILFSFIGSLWLLASSLCVANVSDELQNKLLNFHNMSADFSQTIQTQNQVILQESHGHMVVLKPGKFRWDVEDPIRQLLVMNGEKVWVYDPELKQVVTHQVASQPQQTPVILLFDSPNLLLEKFMIKRSHSKDTLEWFQLISKTENESFSSIFLGFKKDHLVKMYWYDAMNHITQITFENIQLNGKIGQQEQNKLFIFHIPKDATVINQSPSL